MLKSKFKKTTAIILAVLTALSVLAFAPVTADAAATVSTAKSLSYNGITYYMPQINFNSTDVRQINSEIKSVCNPVFTDIQNAARYGYSTGCNHMDYSSMTKNNILSVVIKIRYDGGHTRYYVYNINPYTGKRLSYDQVASAFGTSYSNAKKVVKWTIKDKFYHLDSNTKKNTTWQYSRSRSITDSNINKTKLFVGQNGLYAAYDIYWIAGPELNSDLALVYNSSNPAVNAHGTNNGAQVTWGKVSGVPKYRVYKKVNGSWKKLGDSTGSSYVDKSAKPGNNYVYTVRGIAADGSAFMSGYNTSGKSLKFVSSPVISKMETTPDGLKLTWNKTSGVNKYRVYFKQNGSWRNLGDVTGNTCGLYCYGSGGTFIYTIRALSDDAKQFLSGYTNGKGAKYVYTPEITGISNTSGGVRLSWDKPTGTEKFRLYRKTGSGSWQKITDTTATSYTDTSAWNGTKYTYTVRCISSNGKTFQSYYDTTGKTIICRR